MSPLLPVTQLAASDVNGSIRMVAVRWWLLQLPVRRTGCLPGAQGTAQLCPFGPTAMLALGPQCPWAASSQSLSLEEGLVLGDSCLTWVSCTRQAVHRDSPVAGPTRSRSCTAHDSLPTRSFLPSLSAQMSDLISPVSYTGICPKKSLQHRILS